MYASEREGSVERSALGVPEMTEFKFAVPPKPAGFYRIGGWPNVFQVPISQKPNWLHRTMMRLCLGWIWVDAP